MSDYSMQEAARGVDPRQAMTPDEMPQVIRELTMLRGALEGVSKAAHDIVQKTQPVQRQVPEPDGLSKLSEAFPVTAPLAEELRELSNGCAAIESMLSMATYRIEL